MDTDLNTFSYQFADHMAEKNEAVSEFAKTNTVRKALLNIRLVSPCADPSAAV